MKSQNYFPAIAALACLALLQIIHITFPGLEARLFVQPSGHMAAWLSDRQATTLENGTVAFELFGYSVQVTQACSGISFFMILLTYLVFRCWPINTPAKVLLLLAAWPLSICANSLRILASVATQSVSALVLPAKYADIIHQATGVLVFLSALIALSLLLNLFLSHEYSRRHTTQATA